MGHSFRIYSSYNNDIKNIETKNTKKIIECKIKEILNR